MQVQSVTINQASVNDLPVEEKSVLSSFLSFNHAVYEHQRVAERLHVCLPVCVCLYVWEPHYSQDVCF